MQTHIKVLGVLYIVSGVLGVAAALGVYGLIVLFNEKTAALFKQV